MTKCMVCGDEFDPYYKALVPVLPRQIYEALLGLERIPKAGLYTAADVHCVR